VIRVPTDPVPDPLPAGAPAAAGGRLQAARRHAATWHPTTRALLWSAGAGLSFSVLNAVARQLSLQLDPMQAQFLRYVFGIVVLLPFILRTGMGAGLRAYWPRDLRGQFLRGAMHTAGLVLWFLALPHIPLADTTAIGFTGPIFIMIGAYLFLKEPMRWERWLATGLGFVGVMIVVAPKLSGSGGFWHLVMLASAPVFAASFLLTKALTRYETPGVIVLWQAISVSLFSLPMAIVTWQWPSAWQWFGFLFAGLLGSLGHYCLTRSFSVADISATQSLKFLDLIWAALLGWLIFADLPTQSTLIGGGVICAATLWVAQRERRRVPQGDDSP
jgi:drug/metabolite transporter (DMT)-like permease